MNAVAEQFQQSLIDRIANLKMDEKASVGDARFRSFEISILMEVLSLAGQRPAGAQAGATLADLGSL